MERISILRMGRVLIVTIQVDMHDQVAMTLQDDLTARIVETGARGVLIDISSLEVVDSFIGRILGNIATMSRVLDAQTVVVGMQPAVAITLVELGMSLPGIRTALNLEKGMALLQASIEADEAGIEVSDASLEEGGAAHPLDPEPGAVAPGGANVVGRTQVKSRGADEDGDGRE